jgi:hypothetical protein
MKKLILIFLSCLNLATYSMVQQQKQITKQFSSSLRLIDQQPKPNSSQVKFDLAQTKPLNSGGLVPVKKKKYRKTKGDITREVVPSSSDEDEPVKKVKRLKRKLLLGAIVLGGTLVTAQEIKAEERNNNTPWTHGDVKNIDPRDPEKPTSLNECFTSEDPPKNNPQLPTFKIGTDSNPYIEGLKFAGMFLWDTLTNWKTNKKEEQQRKEKEAQGPDMPDWWLYEQMGRGYEQFKNCPEMKQRYEQFSKEHGHFATREEYNNSQRKKHQPQQASPTLAVIPSLQQVEQQSTKPESKQNPLPQKTAPQQFGESFSQLPVQHEQKKEEKSLGQKMVERGGITFADTIAKTLGSRMANYVADRSEQLLDFMGEQIYNGTIIVGHKAKIALLGKNWDETYDPLEQTKREQIIINYQRDRDLVAEHQTSLKAAMEYQYEVDKARQAVENEYREYDPKSKRVRVRKDKVAELFVKQYPDIPIDLEQNIIVLDNEFHQVHIDTKTHRFLYEKKSRDEINELYGPKPRTTQYDNEYAQKFEATYKNFKNNRDWSSKESWTGWVREKMVRPGACVGAPTAMGYYFPVTAIAQIVGIPVVETIAHVESKIIDKTLGTDRFDYDSPPSDEFKGPSDDEDDKPEQVRPYTHRDIRILAESRGYQETTDYKLDSQGEIVFKKKDKHGNEKYIVFDRKGTSGGYWKVYGGNKGITRLGTYDKDLKRAI